MSKKINPLFYVVALPIACILTLGAIVFFRKVSSADAQPINISTYRQSWRTLNGNTYLLRCQIDQQLGYSEGKGRILKVHTLDAPTPFLVFVPVEVDGTQNFEAGQRYKFTFVLKKDLPYVKNAEKF
jgi:hypothetical protein